MRLYIDNQLSIDENKRNMIGEFCIFCADKLPIEGDFNVFVVSNRKKYGITTTAAYMIGENNCYVYGNNRAVPDIMRSIAHEMTHMMQDQLGLIRGPIRDAGGFHEDQANARAGELLKRFAKAKEYQSMMYERKNR